MRSKKFVGILAGLFVFALGVPALAQDSYSWDFNEGSGTIVKDQTGQYDAKLGDVRVSSETDSPTGKAGDRSIWPVGGLRVEEETNTLFALADSPVTMEAWVKPGNNSGYMDLMRIGNSLKAGFSNGNMVFTLLGVVDLIVEVQVPLDKNWHHVAYVWEPGVGVRYFLDGQEVGYREEARMPRDFQNTWLSVGSDHTGGSPFFGVMDRFRLHNAVLTANQLDKVAGTVAPALDSTLVAYNFDETASPYASNSANAIPAVAMNPNAKDVAPEFSADTPTGQANDYAMYFDGNDRIMYDDNGTYFFDFIEESFTFQVWLKFNALEQTQARPVFFAYGAGGQGGYSFSFRPSSPAIQVEDAPTQQAGDRSIRPQKGLSVDTSFADLINGPLTIETWLKTDAFAETTDIMRIGNSIKAGFFSNKPVFTMLGIVDVNTTFDVPSDGAWHHVAYAWNPGVGVTFYLDGQEAEFVEATGMPREFTEDGMSVGADHGGNYTLTGLMDRFRVHNALLTAAQLDANATSPKAASANTIVDFGFDGAAPYSDSASGIPARFTSDKNMLTVTTFGIVDAHSNAVIPEDGKWHHVAAVFDYDAMEFRFYVDGQLSDTMEYLQGVNPAPLNLAYLYFGCEANGGAPYVGLLDRVRIFRGAMAQDELDYFEPVQVSEWSLY